jgi:hypothetical protein
MKTVIFAWIVRYFMAVKQKCEELSLVGYYTTFTGNQWQKFLWIMVPKLQGKQSRYFLELLNPENKFQNISNYIIYQSTQHNILDNLFLQQHPVRTSNIFV